jgi:PncC family amidohydrolase
MENTGLQKMVFEESYTLYDLTLDEANRKIKEDLPDYRDLSITVSDDTGDIVIRFHTQTEDQRHFNRTLKLFKTRFKDFIMTPPNTSLEKVFFDMMAEKKYHVSTAESCTGGMLSARIINVIGVSSIIEEAFITYSENAKLKVLGVHVDTIKKNGIVSVQTAEEMAKGLKKLTECDLGIAITGIAGPAGGTETVPVGTVCFGFSFHDTLLSFKEWFSGDRQAIRQKAVSFALIQSILLLKNEGKS